MRVYGVRVVLGEVEEKRAWVVPFRQVASQACSHWRAHTNSGNIRQPESCHTVTATSK